MIDADFSGANLYKAQLQGCYHSNQPEIVTALGGKGIRKAIKKIEAKSRADVNLELSSFLQSCNIISPSPPPTPLTCN